MEFTRRDARTLTLAERLYIGHAMGDDLAVEDYEHLQEFAELKALGIRPSCVRIPPGWRDGHPYFVVSIARAISPELPLHPTREEAFAAIEAELARLDAERQRLVGLA